jgi:hypothetical protein
MNIRLYQFLFFLLILICACSDSGSSGNDEESKDASEAGDAIAIEDKTIAGVSEKGPFINGSAVKIYELNFENLGQTGRSYTGKIASDHGDFRFPNVNLVSQYALLEVDGFYRNEVTGKESTAPITLNALVDFSNRRTANINLLTHLAYERMQFLVDDGVSVIEAKKQAEKEILEAFYIKNDSIDNFEDLSIFESGDGNAALLAISILMQGDLPEAKFSSRLANFAYDIEKDGIWNDSVTATEMADWASVASNTDNYASIRKNITDWNLSTTIPKFETLIDKFWWNNYGLGNCSKETEGETKKNQNNLSAYEWQYYQCHDSRWIKAYDEKLWTTASDPDDVMSSVDLKIINPHSVSANYTFKNAFKDTSSTEAFMTIWYYLQSDSASYHFPCYGFKYSYKGDAHDFELYNGTATGLPGWIGNKPVETSKSTTEKIILWHELDDSWVMQNLGSIWGPSDPLSHIVWSVTGNPGKTGALEINDFKCLSEKEVFEIEDLNIPCNDGDTKSGKVSNAEYTCSNETWGI